MVNIETENKDKKKNKSVLLFSGGMDSVMYNYLLKPDIILYIEHKNRYQDEEAKSIDRLIKKGFIDKEKLIIEKTFDLEKFERDDAIIPNRNLYFITLATHYGETVYLGSVNGDRTLDKSIKFYELSKEVFDYLYQEQHWCEERKFIIGSPFKEYTKTELLYKYLEEKGDINAILASYSCYEGKDKPCGWCKPCFRKWVALKNNGVSDDILKDYFKNDPAKAPWIQEILPLIKEKKWRGDEDVYTLKALGL